MKGGRRRESSEVLSIGSPLKRERLSEDSSVSATAPPSLRALWPARGSRHPLEARSGAIALSDLESEHPEAAEMGDSLQSVSVEQAVLCVLLPWRGRRVACEWVARELDRLGFAPRCCDPLWYPRGACALVLQARLADSSTRLPTVLHHAHGLLFALQADYSTAHELRARWRGLPEPRPSLPVPADWLNAWLASAAPDDAGSGETPAWLRAALVELSVLRHLDPDDACCYDPSEVLRHWLKPAAPGRSPVREGAESHAVGLADRDGDDEDAIDRLCVYLVWHPKLDAARRALVNYLAYVRHAVAIEGGPRVESSRCRQLQRALVNALHTDDRGLWNVVRAVERHQKPFGTHFRVLRGTSFLEWMVEEGNGQRVEIRDKLTLHQIDLEFAVPAWDLVHSIAARAVALSGNDALWASLPAESLALVAVYVQSEIDEQCRVMAADALARSQVAPLEPPSGGSSIGSVSSSSSSSSGEE